MDRYHLFNDDAGKIIAIEDNPEAIDKAPYDRIAERRSKVPVDAGLADLALQMFGGEVIYADQATVVINVT